MTELEQLNERIKQLTELVKTGSEAIKSMETALKAAEEERNRLKEQREETEPKFEKVEFGDNYYYVAFFLGGLRIYKETEDHTDVDNGWYINNNYFHTEKRAQEVVDKINFLLKLERLHDIYCPDYTPDWENGDELKYSVFYNNDSKYYCTSIFNVNDYKNNVFFATKEIAQKVRDILNTELEEKK